MPTRLDGGDHVLLAGIPLASCVFLDRADRHALVRDLVVLAPRRERGEEPAVGVRCIDTSVAAHLFEIQTIDAITRLLDLGELAFEAQETHAAPFKALWAEALGAARDMAVVAAQRPAGSGAQIEGEDGRGHGVSPCLGAGLTLPTDHVVTSRDARTRTRV